MNSNLEFWQTLVRQNTGSHMLDSGKFYGYQYERDNVTNPINVDEDSAYMSLAHWLDGMFVPNAKWQNRIDNMVDEDGYSCKYSMDDVFTWIKSAQTGKNKKLRKKYADWKHTAPDYTYGGESDLDQEVIVSYLYNTDTDEIVALVQSHNGCDARGGFSSVVACEVRDDIIGEYYFGELYTPPVTFRGIYATPVRVEQPEGSVPFEFLNSVEEVRTEWDFDTVYEFYKEFTFISADNENEVYIFQHNDTGKMCNVYFNVPWEF